MQKTILRYGLLSGLIASVLMIGTALHFRNTMDFSNGTWVGYAGILLSMLMIYFGVRSYRDNVAGGSLNFGQAFKVGLLITIISCACYVIAWLVVYETLMPDFLEKYAESMLNQLRLSGASEAHIQEQTLEMEKMKTMYQNPLIRTGLTFMEPFPVGLLVTVITSFVLRRRAV